MTLPVDPAGRKGIPINSGVLRFFPATIAGVARVSVAGSKQHGNASLYDDRSKSNDDLDALQRHLADSEVGDGMDRGPYGTDDPVPHVDKAAWRALRHAQKWHEARGAPVAPAAVLPPAGVVDHTLAAAYLRDVAERDDDYQDPHAIQFGAPISPIGAQSGGVVDTTREAYTPINQRDEE